MTSAFRGVVPLLLSLVGGCAEEEPWAVRPPYTPPPLRDAALVTDGGTDGALTDGAGTDGPLDDGGGIDGPLDDGGIDAPSGVDASTAGCLPLGTQPIALRVLGQLCPITNLRPFQGCAPDCRHGDIPMSVPFVSSGRTNADGQFLFADTVSLPATISAGPGGPFVTTTSVVSGTANPVAVPTVYTTTLDAVLADTGLTMRDGDVLLVLETISGSSFATGVTFTAVSGTVSTIYYATEDDWTATPPTVGIGLIAVAVTRGAVEIRGTTVDGRTATFRNTASTPGARRVSFLRSTLVP